MSTKKISILSLEDDLGKLFIQQACGMPMPAENGFRTLGDIELQVGLGKLGEIDTVIEGADRIIALLRHMDLISIAEIKKIIEQLETKAGGKYAVVLFKNSGEKEYKVSCIECGQKIMVPDGQVGAKARCPKCKKTFDIMSREEHLKLLIKGVGSPPVALVEKDAKDTFDTALNLLFAEEEKPKSDTATPSSKPKIVLKKRS